MSRKNYRRHSYRVFNGCTKHECFVEARGLPRPIPDCVEPLRRWQCTKPVHTNESAIDTQPSGDNSGTWRAETLLH